MEQISFVSGHRRLPGRIFGPRDGAALHAAVLFVHGQGSSQEGYEHRARTASRDLNAVCLTFDLSGHGRDAENFDKYSVHDHLEDVVAAYDYLASQGTVDAKRVGVCGASYGGYLSALLTAHRAVRRLILRAPSLAEYAPEGPDSLDVLGRYAGEVLIVESEKDEVIPARTIAAYVNACTHAQHQVIPGAAHALTNPTWDDVFVRAIVNWFASL
jgi:dienelactone hydrolase